MSKIDLSKYLEEKLYNIKDHLDQTFVDSDSLRENIESICRSSTKASIRFLMSCLIAKIDNPKLDIRKPYTEIGGGDSFSGRSYDETYIEPFVLKYKLPCNSTTAYLTPSFRNHNKVLSTDVVIEGRPKELYVKTLEILDIVHSNNATADDILIEIIKFLLIIKNEDATRMSQLLNKIKSTSDIFPLSSEDIMNILIQHLRSNKSSRLPVLIVASAYESVKNLTGEYNKPLNAHNAADSQTGSFGDIEIVLTSESKIVTCYEMKDKKVTKGDIELALMKINSGENEINNYIFITTDTIEQEVQEYAMEQYNKVGVEFVILHCIGFIRHFLHFFHRYRINFLNYYQQMVIDEPTSSVSQTLKEVFLTLRANAENSKANGN